jgi:cytochrome c-type biogenesis protein
MTSITFPAAFAAGTLSFLSPCVLPLVPGYLAFLAGSSAGEARRGAVGLTRALAFSAGFSLVFLALGASASTVGQLLSEYRTVLSTIGGIVVLIFGMHLAGLLTIPFLLREARLHPAAEPAGHLGALAVGAAFGFGWSPCIGPLLGGVLTLAATETTAFRGMLLLAAYAAGLALPFIGAAIAADRFLVISRRIRPALPWVQRGGGVLLAGFGILLLTGHAGIIGRWVPGFEALAF